MKRVFLCIFALIMVLLCAAACAEETEIVLSGERYGSWIEDVGDRIDVDVFVGGDRYVLYSGEIENYAALEAQFGGKPVWSFEQDDTESIQLHVFLGEDSYQISQAYDTVQLVGDVHCTMTCTWGNLTKEVDFYLHIKESPMGVPTSLVISPSNVTMQLNGDFIEPEITTDIDGWYLDGYFPECSFSWNEFDPTTPGIYAAQVFWDCANYSLYSSYNITVLNEDGSTPSMVISMQAPYSPWTTYYLEGEDDHTPAFAYIHNYHDLKAWYGGDPTATVTKLSGPDDFTFQVNERIFVQDDGASVTLNPVGHPTKEGVSEFRFDITWGDSSTSTHFSVTAESLINGVPTGFSDIPEQIAVLVGEQFEIPAPQFLPAGWEGNHKESTASGYSYSTGASQAIDFVADTGHSYIFTATAPGTYEIKLRRYLMNTNFAYSKPVKVIILNPDALLTADMVTTYQQPLLLRQGESFNLHCRLADPTIVEEVVWSSTGSAVSVSGNRVTAVNNGNDTLTLTAKGVGGQTVTKTVEVKVGALNVLQLPSRLTTVEADAFAGISTDRLVIGTNMETFDPAAFLYTDQVNSIYFAGDIPGITIDEISIIKPGQNSVPIICPEGSHIQEVLEGSLYEILTY